MDSEKFDKVVLDLLYDELDELTRASAVRHMEQSARARQIYSSLRATREVGAFPMVDPPADLEDRILAAEELARADRSFFSRLGTMVTVMAGYAMKPQLAMAALLLLMLGSSLIFLRARPGVHERVQVTERGVPESENETVAIVPADKTPAAAPPGEAQAHGPLKSARRTDDGHKEQERKARAPEPAGRAFAARNRASDEPKGELGSGLADFEQSEEGFSKKTSGTTGAHSPSFSDALLAYREGRFAEARDRFDEIARAGSDDAATAMLFAGRATEKLSGCEVARSRYEEVANRFEGAHVAVEAQWLAAECLRELGETELARRGYQRLLLTPDYKARAEQALAALNEGAGRSSDAVATKQAKPSPTREPPATAARPAPARAPAAPPPSTTP